MERKTCLIIKDWLTLLRARNLDKRDFEPPPRAIEDSVFEERDKGD